MRFNPSLEEELISKNWKDFEAKVAEILLANDFEIKKNFRIGREEIDILAIGSRYNLAIECKRWRKPFIPLKTIERHIAKTQKIQSDKKIYPIFVTLFEDKIFYRGVWLVPIYKLNNFLIEIDKYLD